MKLKEYTKQDLEGKELVLITYDSGYFDKKPCFNIRPFKVAKITDKTVLGISGSRIPLDEVAVLKPFGRLICAREDVEEVITKYKEVTINQLHEQIEKNKKDMLDYAKAEIKFL